MLCEVMEEARSGLRAAVEMPGLCSAKSKKVHLSKVAGSAGRVGLHLGLGE